MDVTGADGGHAAASQAIAALGTANDLAKAEGKAAVKLLDSNESAQRSANLDPDKGNHVDLHV